WNRRTVHGRLPRKFVDHQFKGVRVQYDNGVVGKLHWQISHCRIEVGKPFVVCAKDNCAKPSVGCHGTPRSLNAPYRRTGAGGTSCPPVRGMSDARAATTRWSAT